MATPDLKVIGREEDAAHANGDENIRVSLLLLQPRRGGAELNRVRALVIEHRVAFKEAWHGHFGTEAR